MAAMASTDPSPLTAAVSLDMARAAEPIEVMRVGTWSVKQFKDPTMGLVFVNVETGRTQMEPPQEVIDQIDLEGDGLEAEEGDGGSTTAEGDRPSSSGGDSSRARTAETNPQFRRIVLGSSCEVPLKMARDILHALREDASIFDTLQARFSDNNEEACFGLGLDSDSDHGVQPLPADLQNVAMSLRVGEFSDVIGTEAGMQILLRVA